MNLVIAGSRTFTDVDKSLVFWRLTYSYVEILSVLGEEVTEVGSGMAKGIDTFGKEWAEEHNLPFTPFPADWDTLGKKAGYIRNEEMAIWGDALVAIWDGQSKGTKHMIDLAQKHKLVVRIHRLQPGAGRGID